ncbi:hypothetical protein HON52_04850 [Candidatus Uhrbacteria bacterium]|jgi:hypothetical protein|nr:hypothetical protein [Candidatus Uhrbacteria bacterium]
MGIFKRKPKSTELTRSKIYLVLAVLLVALVLGIVQKMRGGEYYQTSDEELYCIFSGATWDSEQGICSAE